MHILEGKKIKNPLKRAFKRVLLLFDTKIVGVRGFEPPTSSSRTTRAAGLRYTPIFKRNAKIMILLLVSNIINIDNGITRSLYQDKKQQNLQKKRQNVYPAFS